MTSAQRTKTTFTGAVQVGEDLMSIEIGDEVKVSNIHHPTINRTEIIKQGFDARTHNNRFAAMLADVTTISFPYKSQAPLCEAHNHISH
jgi:hypothetical protein